MGNEKRKENENERFYKRYFNRLKAKMQPVGRFFLIKSVNENTKTRLILAVSFFFLQFSHRHIIIIIIIIIRHDKQQFKTTSKCYVCVVWLYRRTEGTTTRREGEATTQIKRFHPASKLVDPNISKDFFF